MARPKKNNADYFSHDADMRNDDRIKAVRKKFKILGYAIYNMLLEYLTDKDFLKIEYNELSLELMAGDFDEDPDTLKKIIDYFIQLDLFQLEGTYLRCKTLESRLAAVYEKREKSKEKAKTQPRVNGRFCSNNTDEPDIPVEETPQSKVKKSKVFVEIGAPTEKYIIVKSKYTNQKHKKIYDLSQHFETSGQLDGLTSKGWTYFEAFLSEVPGRMFNDEDHLYNAFRSFSEKYKPPARAPNPFVSAEVDFQNMTLEAWKKMYSWDLKNNPEFIKHFNGKLSASQPVGSKP